MQINPATFQLDIFDVFYFIAYNKGMKTFFFVNDQVVNILGFTDHIVSIITAHS